MKLIRDYGPQNHIHYHHRPINFIESNTQYLYNLKKYFFFVSLEYSLYQIIQVIHVHKDQYLLP
jgi:hypothetical protein